MLKKAMNFYHKPFLKWAGNKSSILPILKKNLPHKERLIEPFVGSGALFLNTSFPQYLLGDINPDLIHLFSFVKQEGLPFIQSCKTFFIPSFNEAFAFYPLREQFNSTQDKKLRAFIFLYLNKHGYNGLCRYNSAGKFNTPFGKFVKPYFPEKEMIFFHHKVQWADLVLSDFQTTMSHATEKDVVYCDPPYVPLSKTSDFTSYHTDNFTPSDQIALAELAYELSKKGVDVLISNHDTEFTRRIYKPASVILSHQVKRFISCKGEKRNKAPEILAIFSSQS